LPLPQVVLNLLKKGIHHIGLIGLRAPDLILDFQALGSGEALGVFSNLIFGPVIVPVSGIFEHRSHNLPAGLGVAESFAFDEDRYCILIGKEKIDAPTLRTGFGFLLTGSFYITGLSLL
jgi:hypothetical protein